MSCWYQPDVNPLSLSVHFLSGVAWGQNLAYVSQALLLLLYILYRTSCKDTWNGEIMYRNPSIIVFRVFSPQATLKTFKPYFHQKTSDGFEQKFYLKFITRYRDTVWINTHLYIGSIYKTNDNSDLSTGQYNRLQVSVET